MSPAYPIESTQPAAIPAPKTGGGEKGFYIPSLDGLRAFSILIVFLSHAGMSHVVPGLFGVTIFFFLSGYLITTLLRLEWERHGRIHLGQFWIRRVLRIFPPLYLVLGVVTLLTVTGALKMEHGGELRAEAVLAQAFYFANYYDIAHPHAFPPGTAVLWSLAVEEHFYLLFPLLYIFLQQRVRNRAHQAAWLWGLCGVVLAWRFILVFALHQLEAPGAGYGYIPRIAHATDTRLDAILLGCILAIQGNPVLDPTRISRQHWLYLWLPVAVVTLLVTFVCREAWFRETFRYSLQGLAMFPIFIAAIRFPDWPPFRLLNWAPVKWIGLLSYTLYLTHSSIYIALGQWVEGIHPLAQGVLAAVFSIGVSALIYQFLEKPCADLRKRLSAKFAKA